MAAERVLSAKPTSGQNSETGPHFSNLRACRTQRRVLQKRRLRPIQGYPLLVVPTFAAHFLVSGLPGTSTKPVLTARDGIRPLVSESLWCHHSGLTS